MASSRFDRIKKAVWWAAVTMAASGALGAGAAHLSSQETHGPATHPATSTVVDAHQRTYEVLGNNEVAASGAARGEVIYFYKCWMCHNNGARNGDKSGLVGPSLANLTARLKTDEALASKIAAGGPRMPAFRHTLAAADLADLISYLKKPGCCYENQEPPKNPHYNAETIAWPVSSGLKGGARGQVRFENGKPLEGIKVQLIAPNHVRTTVFTNAEGRYEFPPLQAGSYILRVATPAPFRAYTRDRVSIKGASPIDDVVLELIPNVEPVILRGGLAPTREVMSQLSGAEWLWNLPGTADDKSTFVKACGIGCHSYELVFRNRYDERSWALIVERMKTGAQGGPGRAMDPQSESGSVTQGEIAAIAKWLAAVRGPDSQDAPVRMWTSRPTGAATRAVITEYEVNRRLLNLHDVCGDAKGNIWFNSWHAPQVGYLDPRTGVIKEFRLPAVDGGGPVVGSHACRVDDKRGYVWFSMGPSQPGKQALYRLTMATGEIKQFPAAATVNFGLAPDGFLWDSRNNGDGTMDIVRIDPESGEIVKRYPRTPWMSYQHDVTSDGRFVAGSGPVGPNYNVSWMLDVASGKVYETTTPEQDHGAARGGFDPFGDAWFGGRGGPLVRIINEIDKGKGIRTQLYWPPTPLFPYTDFYTATPDKNGEVWGGIAHGRGFVRFNPKTEKWTVYENPEPSALNRFQWIDNSTTPPTIWYPDFLTQMIVRIQPLE
ncbi:MAG TPA: c-type cytochrome [Vicinamibacterales bacterium]|jgi:streptogramin lyase/mono/diheme cytochrome c family protein